VVTASTILKTLLGEYAGELNKKQKDMLVNALARCQQAIVSAERMMVMTKFSEQMGIEGFVTDLVGVSLRLQQQYAEEADHKKIWFSVDIDEQSVYVRGQEEITTEVLNALLGNAFKYTPHRYRNSRRGPRKDFRAILPYRGG
jgi:signal transduction histidine kinase